MAINKNGHNIIKKKRDNTNSEQKVIQYKNLEKMT